MNVLIVVEYRHATDKYRYHGSRDVIGDICPIATAINEVLDSLFHSHVSCSEIRLIDTVPWGFKAYISKTPINIGSWILDMDVLNSRTEGRFTEEEFVPISFIVEIPVHLIF